MKIRVFVIFILLLSSLTASISADNNIQSADDLSSEQIANRLYDFTTDNPNIQNINDAISSDSKIIHDNPSNSIEYVSQVDKLDTVIASGEISATDNVDWDQNYVISGILQASTPWSFANVELYINETLFDVTVTDGNGAYTFTLTFDRTNISYYDYRVYFPNDEDDEFRVPGDIKIGSFIVQDTTVITFTVDKDSVGPQETYTVSVVVKDGGGADVDPDSVGGLAVSYSEDYGIDTNEGGAYNGSNVFVASKSSYSDEYHPSVEAEDTITVTATLTGTANFPLINFGTPGTIQILVTAEIIYTLLTKDIGGAAINTSKHYYRSDQLIELEASLTSSTLDVTGRAYSVSISGGGYAGTNPVATGTSNSSGGVYFSYTLSVANFPDPSADITITLSFSDTAINPSLRSVNILLIEDLLSVGDFDTSKTLNASLHLEDLSFFPGVNDQITITGKVLDINSVAAKNVYLIMSLNNKDTVNDPWAGHSRLWYTPGIKTNSTGQFKYTISSFSYLLSISGWMTFNVTFDPALNTNWADPGDITGEALSFRYFRTIITTVDQDTSGANVTLNQNVISSFDRFNDTFDVYTDSDRAIGSAFYPTITDSFGRVPVGISYYYEIQGFYQGSTQTIAFSDTITIAEGLAENNGVFELAFSTFVTQPEYTALINSEGTYFRIFIRVAGQNADIATVTYEHRYYTYGPDDTAPVITNVDAIGADSGKEDNITIIATLDFTASHFDNIRSVTLYYRFSDNLVADENDAAFTAGFTSQTMAFYVLTQKYNHTLDFGGHGSWVQWYIIVLDYSGYGLDVNGDTENPGLPSYDGTVTLNATWGSVSSPITNKMGDTSITVPDLNQHVRVNGQLLIDSLNVTLFTNITIQLNLAVDLSGYTLIKIYIRYIEYEPLNGTIVNTTEWVEYDLIYLYTTGGFDIYAYLIDVTASPLDWFTQIDYYFNFTDGAGNNGFTQPLSQLVEADDTLKETWVTDEVFPIETTGGNVTLPSQVGRNNTAFLYVLWTNETSLVFITYNVTDGTGSGLYNISVIYYVTFENGTTFAVETIYFVINGQIVDTGGLALDAAVQDFYVIEFGLPADYFIENYNISWEVHILDRANQVTVLNDQADNPIQVEIQLPPVPPPPPPDDTDTQELETVLSTDEDGIVHTNVQPVEETSNIVWIMIGFVGGLMALILYYQRNNIREYLARSARKKKVQGTLRDLTDEIKRLGQAGKYKAAILLTWEALERISKEIIQYTRPFNQTASEFVIYLSTITIVELETLMTLSTAFEKTRYGKDSPTEDDFDDAVKALLITAQTIIESGAKVKIDEDEDF